eukprot:NODE_450_length_2240_cov_9.285714_g416_i0.p1 GENE.NODE_450_length_2240_cov_9.285714_g416_i0~~NODE_450_length_2240_cov_9.285714_g416_i0.p1  ORF type:complete len:525 (-),score=90.20 NODE_450_length_2240_cov_9.285714_g416_i0:665-2125(-)
MPKDRKLREFASQSLIELPATQPDRSRVLLYWYVEDLIKRLYYRYIHTVIGHGIAQPHTLTRQHWMKCAFILLNQIPEQETSLLAMLVDKVGDPAAKVAARAVHYLQTFLEQHPAALPSVLSELERFLYRPHNPINARFHGITLINAIPREAYDAKIANKLLTIYTIMLRGVIMEGQTKHRLLRAVLAGMRRILPYMTNSEDLLRYRDTLFTVAAEPDSLRQRVEALALLLHLMVNGQPDMERRYYTSLYHVLMMNPQSIPTNNRLAALFSLLYRSLMATENDECVAAFCHRLLQMCQHHSVTFACSTLMMISEISTQRKGLKDLIRKPAKGGRVPYDPNARVPMAANATEEPFWLLERLTHHYHPLVVQFSLFLLSGQKIVYVGSPLNDFCLMEFLNQFIIKDPNSTEPEKKESRNSRKRIPYNSPAFWRQAPEKVPLDEVHLSTCASVAPLGARLVWPLALFDSFDFSRSSFTNSQTSKSSGLR